LRKKIVERYSVRRLAINFRQEMGLNDSSPGLKTRDKKESTIFFDASSIVD